MGRLLQVGVLLASFVMLIGGLFYVKAHHGSIPDYRVFNSEPQALRHVDGVINGVAAGDPAAIIQLAVLLLIATPVARVVFALIAFGIERDKLYVGVSAIVLAVLLFGFLRSQ
ncbi:DUF1634 domain-containing protein [Telmatobacter sp. DSM 110680]|uniref:DUF1634 domain-containing protein n=1 Tax=Telmatobacter sp. DSM 110680 TaxID=3036704 RepID=A0AAU7DC85_9BACT